TSRKEGTLRGCLGELEPIDPLYKVIQRATIKTATSDFRFLPVQKEELSQIKIELSVISEKKLINDWRKIKLGKEGVMIEGWGRSGVFLPEVALEAGWDLEEFLSNLCTMKAGLPADCYKNPKVKIYVFEVEKIKES
ncbi:MAG: AmmeMemoRadiSam system protein A, partial [Candidatus Omnitrophica bacterium]|nr:AmmeMemoRadiSam system protein A [Candidatus Omnitrophota bacterium]